MNITSTDNKIIKITASLAEKKYRDREDSYVVEGPNLVREAIEQGGRIRFLFTRAGQPSEEIAQIVDLALERGLAVHEVSGEVFSKISQTETPQGILAVLLRQAEDADSFFEACKSRNVLVLDRVQDPGNIGSLLRTAEAAGAGGVLALKGTADVYAPKTVRAASGSLMRLPVLTGLEAEEAVRLLKRHGKKLVATAMQGSRNYYECNLARDAAVVIGNEGGGVSASLLAAADEVIRIPMRGGIESLNAAIAGAIILYEGMRQAKHGA